jgi:CDP-diacylglycerol--serine O-phosphatidyltransferase
VKKHIPNFLTCCNLLCGCIGIVQAFNGNLYIAAYLTGIAAIFDFLDGMMARVLKAYSDIGKELDSLADMVTFGVLPSVIIFKLMETAYGYGEGFCLGNLCITPPYIAFLIAVFSALRLAKFNVDTRQSDSFIGVPTPANAIFMNSLPLVMLQMPELQDMVLNMNTLVFTTLLFSFLLVSPLPLFSLKMKNFTFEDNKIRYTFLAIALALIIAFSYIAIPLIILLYIVLSILNLFLK